MNILITGAKGFVGKNLTAALQNIKDGKDKTRPEITVDELYLYDIDSDPYYLEEACKKADFVFNLAGVNRPQTQEEFMQGNFGFASFLLSTLKKYNNTCPVMLSSSIQATLIGRYAEGEYGKSEMWYIVDCDEGAFIYYGFSRDVSREECESAIKDGTLTSILNAVPVKRGDAFYIEAGTVHAIGAGCLTNFLTKYLCDMHILKTIL